jgi:protein gp37
MGETKIEWTDIVDNIIVVEGGGWWCRHISSSCDHCYAEALNQNTFFGGNKMPYRGAAPSLHLRADIVNGWAQMRKPKKHFVASMTDVFGEWVPRWMICMMLDGMAAAPLQIFQVLTKRPHVAAVEIEAWLKAAGRSALPDNIWIGATTENQEQADKRIPELLKIPARVRFLSCEPLLGPVDLSRFHIGWWRCPECGEARDPNEEIPLGSSDAYCLKCNNEDMEIEGHHLHWVIVGGESGPNSRECNLDWIHSLTEQCSAAGVPVFVKQLGSKPVYADAATKQIIPFPISDKKGAHVGDFPCHFQREFPRPEHAF